MSTCITMINGNLYLGLMNDKIKWKYKMKVVIITTFWSLAIPMLRVFNNPMSIFLENLIIA